MLQATKKSDCSLIYISDMEMKLDLLNLRKIDCETHENSDGRQIERAKRISVSLLENNILFIEEKTS